MKGNYFYTKAGEYLRRLGSLEAVKKECMDTIIEYKTVFDAPPDLRTKLSIKLVEAFIVFDDLWIQDMTPQERNSVSEIATLVIRAFLPLVEPKTKWLSGTDDWLENIAVGLTEFAYCVGIVAPFGEYFITLCKKGMLWGDRVTEAEAMTRRS